MNSETLIYSIDAHFVHDFEQLHHYVIYENPKDAPEKHIIRQWAAFECFTILKAGVAYVCESLVQARSLVPNGLVCMNRMPGDDPCIVEVWI